MDSGAFGWLAGITTLFIVAIVVSNTKGVANIITGLGNLYGSVIPGFKPTAIK
jgi:hypothetical protein